MCASNNVSQQSSLSSACLTEVDAACSAGSSFSGDVYGRATVTVPLRRVLATATPSTSTSASSSTTVTRTTSSKLLDLYLCQCRILSGPAGDGDAPALPQLSKFVAMYTLSLPFPPCRQFSVHAGALTLSPSIHPRTALPAFHATCFKKLTCGTAPRLHTPTCTMMPTTTSSSCLKAASASCSSLHGTRLLLQHTHCSRRHPTIARYPKQRAAVACCVVLEKQASPFQHGYM